MKKFLAVVCIFFCYATPILSKGELNPQHTVNKYSINLWAGVVNSSLSGETGFPIFGPYKNNKIGLSLGFTGELFLTSIFSVESGLFYIQSGGSSEEQTGTDDQGRVLGKFHFTQELEYLELPIYLKINYNIKGLNSFLLFGPNWGILLSATEKFKPDYTTSTEYNENIKEVISKHNFNINLGFGIKYPILNHLKLNTTCVYSIGIKDHMKDNSIAGSQKTEDLKIYAGLSYYF